MSGPPLATVVFGVGDSSKTLSVATDDDVAIEDPSTVTATITNGEAAYQIKTGAGSASVVVLDDMARLALTVGPAEITEGVDGAVIVEITNGVTFATDQTITLSITGTATAGDYTVHDASNRVLTTPYVLTLPAGDNSVTATITAADDTAEESSETIVVAVDSQGERRVDSQYLAGTLTTAESPASSPTTSFNNRASAPSSSAGCIRHLPFWVGRLPGIARSSRPECNAEPRYS